MPPNTYNPRAAAAAIVAHLQQAGHVAYLAGGCVRDRLLGQTPKDYDIATAATPDQVRKIFPKSRYVGEAFGVVLVAPPRSATGHPPTGLWFEVATFRKEWGYDDHRRPSHVEFTDAQEDAHRRDFTVNALFEDPLTPPTEPPTIIDFVGGQKDLAARRLRAVGDPNHRFEEDKLRLLRAVRFATRLGFDLDPDTEAAIKKHAPGLSNISRERIGDEIRRMLCRPPDQYPAVRRAVGLIHELALDAPVLDTAALGPIPLDTLARLATGTDYPTRLTAWLLDLSLHPTPHRSALTLAPRIRAALNLTNDERDTLRHHLDRLPRLKAWPGLDLAARKRLLAEPHAAATLDLFDAQHPGNPIAPAARDLLRNTDVAPDRLVTGADLLALGVPPGPGLGDLLEHAYDRQLEEPALARDTLLDWVRSRI